MSGKIKWNKYYKETGKDRPLYPESFVIRMFMGTFPSRMIPVHDYVNKTILDLSSGYGRNIPFLSSLGFKVYGSEISEKLVSSLAGKFNDLTFFDTKLPNLCFEDNRFDYILSCNSSYYLRMELSYANHLEELYRVLRFNGYLACTILHPSHSIFDNSTFIEGNRAIIHNDKQNVRDNMVLGYVPDQKTLENDLSSIGFSDICIAEVSDQYMGFNRRLFYFTCNKNKNERCR